MSPGPEKSPHTKMLGCSEDGCKASYADHRWGQTQASAEGWFNSRDGETRWCPDHLPDWVGPWREDRAQIDQSR